jgi:hypothetical protein
MGYVIGLFVLGILFYVLYEMRAEDETAEEVADEAIESLTQTLNQAADQLKQRTSNLHLHQPKSDFDKALAEAVKDN